jgi:plastocyanin
MIFRWRTFFRLLLPLAAVIAEGASVSGGFTLADSKDPVVRKKRDYSGIAVWLEPISAKPPPSQPRVHTMLQTKKKFQPHVLMVEMGSTVDFPNLDPIFHNAFSNFDGQPFDVGLYPPGTTQKVKFVREGIVHVFCNIHSMMSAVIIVVNSPWFAVTRQDGSFRIPNVPAGEYRLRVWHERASQPTLARLQKGIEVTTPDVDLPIAAISELGYIDLPHSNKFGKDYPPAPSATGKY